jgi:regulator of CtrA degradation
MIEGIYHHEHMLGHDKMAPVRRAQIENLYRETLVLADEAQHIFADAREHLHADGDQELSVAAFSEAMMTAARLTHILAWLLHQRAVMAGEPGAYAGDSAANLAGVAAADWNICHQLDEPMRRVTAASERLYERITMLEDLWAEPRKLMPVQGMLAELAARL